MYTLSRGLVNEESYNWGSLRVVVGPCREAHLARNFFRPEIDWLTHAISKREPRFIHAHWTYEFALAALRSGIPTITTIHDLPWRVFRHFCDPYRFVRLLMAYEVAMRGRRFTAVSNDAAAHFRHFFNPLAQVAVITNGLSDPVFELGVHPPKSVGREPVFATVMQGWSRQKNATTALRAFQIVLNETPNAKLLMFGADYEPNGKAHQWAVQHSLDANVTFVGLLPNKQLLEQISDEVDIVVHPSLNESFSMTALEAMALRKPVIAGERTPGVREVLGFGESGVLTDVTNPKAMAEAMVRLGCDDNYRRSMAKSGYDRASLFTGWKQ